MNEKTQLTNEELRANRKAAKKSAFLQNAEKSNKYYGRRYLGNTNNGKEIWITMRFDRIDLQISLEVNGDLNDLLKEGAVLAPVRVTQRLGNKNQTYKTLCKCIEKMQEDKLHQELLNILKN